MGRHREKNYASLKVYSSRECDPIAIHEGLESSKTRRHRDEKNKLFHYQRLALVPNMHNEIIAV